MNPKNILVKQLTVKEIYSFFKFIKETLPVMNMLSE